MSLTVAVCVLSAVVCVLCLVVLVGLLAIAVGASLELKNHIHRSEDDGDGRPDEDEPVSPVGGRSRWN